MLGLQNIPYVAKNLLKKNLANRTSRGKNLRGVFLNVFRYPEFESAIRMAIFSPDHEISYLLCLFVRDCKQMNINPRLGLRHFRMLKGRRNLN